MAVAQLANDCAPASSADVRLPPDTKLGASLTAVTVMVKVCGAEVSTPPPAVPPLSDKRQRDRRRAAGVDRRRVGQRARRRDRGRRR